MKHTNGKSLQALLLAAAMVFTSLPAVPLGTAYAATTTTGKPELSFTKGDNGDNKKGTVITGSEILIKESVPKGYVNQGITIKGTESIVYKEGITVPAGNTKIEVDKQFNPATGSKVTGDATALSAEGVYNFSGSYYALLADGDVSVKNKQGSTANGSIVAETQSAVTEYSECIIECTAAETGGQSPSFKFADTQDATKLGVFKDFIGGGNEVVVVNSTKDPSKPKEMTIKMANENKVLQFKVKFEGMVYDQETENAGTKDDDGTLVKVDGKPVPKPKEQWDNYVRKGTTFKLIFRMPESEPLFLTVMTPQKAMEYIEDYIRQSDGSTNDKNKEEDQKFILLAEGNDLEYISEDFKLRRSSNHFGGRFLVEWKWQPNEEQIVDGETKYLSKDMTEAEKKKYQDAVEIGSNNLDWQPAAIHPIEEDVRGTLTATVSYYVSGGGTQTSVTGTAAKPGTQLAIKNVIIRGTGKPVGVTQTSEIGPNEDGVVEEILFGEDERKLPDGKQMDAYQGNVPEFKMTPVGPYRYELELNMGAKNGAASYAIAELTGYTDGLVLKTQQGSETEMDYKPGEKIENKQVDNSAANKIKLILEAKRLPQDMGAQRATLTVKFFIPDRNGKPQESSSKFVLPITLNDNTPSQNSLLRSFFIRDSETGKEIPFNSTRFDKNKLEYKGESERVLIPYKTKSITITPVLDDIRGIETEIKIEVQNLNGTTSETHLVRSGTNTKAIEFQNLDEVRQLIVTVTAQDPRPAFKTTYKLEIVRLSPSTDATLKSLGFYLPDDDATKPANNLLKNFDPNTKEYDILVPYSTKRLRVLYETNNSAAELKEVLPEPGLEGMNVFDPAKQWLKDLRKKFSETKDGVLEVKFNILAEDEKSTQEYIVKVHRADPNNDATLKSMKVTDIESKDLAYTPGLKPNGPNYTYTLQVPYSTSQIKLNLEPNDPNVDNIKVYDRVKNEEHLVLNLYEGNDGTPGNLKPGIESKPLDVLSLSDSAIKEDGCHTFYIVVTAENGVDEKEYVLMVQRALPNTDALLKTLVLKDQDGQQIKTFAFNPEDTSYTLSVPYETRGISLTPTSNDPNAVIRIGENSVTSSSLVIGSGTTSRVFELNGAGAPKRFEVLVTAEDGKTTKTYSVTLTREDPSNDARLKNLTAGNIEGKLSPQFIASKTKYSATVAEGAPGVTITATANHPAATITVNGNVVASGQASDLIELLKIKEKVEIVVTAQDGVTKETYTIEFTNQNLIEKTSNADLRRLTVNYGQMTPDFKAAVTEYEIATTEDTYSIDIIPRPADSLATVRVLSGSKEIGDYNGNYSQALEDGENEISIEVTSPDKTVTKVYSLTIYRNEEEGMKNLKPLEASDIDFETSDNLIVVMIDEYPRVSSSVFEELKNYPEKTIVFQGNDYSIEFKAADLKKVIPQREIYDFRLSFDSPEEDDIYSLIDERSRNDDIISRTVMVYFPYHGSLPGTAALHLSLGHRYANEQLFWHYYNMERERLDYYGVLNSNRQGTIAVKIDHFSTYVISPVHRIAGSEDKMGVVDELGLSTPGNSIDLSTGSKLHPNTGVQEVEE